jgi:hypothetical protein
MLADSASKEITGEKEGNFFRDFICLFFLPGQKFRTVDFRFLQIMKP